MKPSDFAKSHKINKALGNSGIMFSKGDSLLMNNCKYKVMSPTGAKYAMLEDERGMRIALPANKVSLLIKAGFARRYVNQYGMYKAQMPGMPSGGGMKGVPVGTVKQDSKGEWRKKVSANPSTWVHMSSGTAHPDHETDASHHPLLHDESRRHAVSVHTKIIKDAHPGDHDKLKSKFKEYLNELSAFKNLMQAHNTAEVDEKGKKQPRAILPKSTLNNVYKREETAETHKEAFIKMFQASIKKKATNG